MNPVVTITKAAEIAVAFGSVALCAPAYAQLPVPSEKARLIAFQTFAEAIYVCEENGQKDFRASPPFLLYFSPVHGPRLFRNNFASAIDAVTQEVRKKPIRGITAGSSKEDAYIRDTAISRFVKGAEQIYKDNKDAWIAEYLLKKSWEVADVKVTLEHEIFSRWPSPVKSTLLEYCSFPFKHESDTKYIYNKIGMTVPEAALKVLQNRRVIEEASKELKTKFPNANKSDKMTRAVTSVSSLLLVRSRVQALFDLRVLQVLHEFMTRGKTMRPLVFTSVTSIPGGAQVPCENETSVIDQIIGLFIPPNPPKDMTNPWLKMPIVTLIRMLSLSTEPICLGAEEMHPLNQNQA